MNKKDVDIIKREEQAKNEALKAHKPHKTPKQPVDK